jgi:hypothetical protein
LPEQPACNMADETGGACNKNFALLDGCHCIPRRS